MLDTMLARIKNMFDRPIDLIRPSTITRSHWGVMAIFLVSALLFFFIVPLSPAHALIDEIVAGIGEVILDLLLAITRILLALAVFLLRFFILLASYNGYLDAPIVILGWTMVRDIANMFFVVILLVIAFATILGKENYEWKKTLVKLVLAAIFINFSLLIAGIVIDAAHVFTVTFLNAIAPAAGGNLINMMNLQEINQIVTNGSLDNAGDIDIRLDLYAGVILSLIFALLAMLSIGAYALIMLIRVVYLWILLILSPLAFVFSVLPATKAQSDEWVKEFTKYVISAPIAVFFLWLAFASFGSAGSAAETINQGATYTFGNTGENSLLTTNPEDAYAAGQAASISKASTWANMASFLVAIGFLLAGIDRVQKLGVKGSGFLSKATSVAGQVATYAAGIRLAQWGARKTAEGGRFVGRKFPVVGAEALGDHWNILKTGIKASAWRAANTPADQQGILGRTVGKAMGLTISRRKRLGKLEDAAEKEEDLAFARNSSEARGYLGFYGTPQWAKDMAAEYGLDAAKIPVVPMLEGQIEAEDELKGSKKSLAKEIGRQSVLNAPRIKDGEQKDGDTVQAQIAKNQVELETLKAEGNASMEQAKADELAKNPELLQRQHAAELLTQAANNFVKKINNLDLKEQYKAAGKFLTDVIGKSEVEQQKLIDDMTSDSTLEKMSTPQEVRDAYFQQAIVKALRNAKLAERDDDTRKSITDANNAAEDAFINKESTPSTFLADESEKIEKSYANYNYDELMNRSTSFIPQMLKQLLSEGPLNTRQSVDLFGLIRKLQSENVPDDSIENLVGELKDYQSYLTNPNAFSSEDQDKMNSKAESMEALAIAFSRLGWINGNVASGKDKNQFNAAAFSKENWKNATQFDRRKAQDFQNLAAVGGDLSLIEAHHAIEDKMMNDKKFKGMEYRDVAKAVLPSANISGISSYKEFAERLEEYQELISESKKVNNSAGDKNGHSNLAFNQVFDKKMGVFRFATVAEAEGTTHEIRQRGDSAKYIRNDQYQSYGTIDQGTTLAYNLRGKMIGTALGGVTHESEVKNMNDRTSKALSFITTGETAQSKKRGNKQFAVIGGQAMSKVAKAQGYNDSDEGRRDFMIKNGYLASMLEGKKGTIFRRMRDFKHITSRQANEGRIHEIVGDQVFETFDDFVKFMHETLKKDSQYLKGTEYEGKNVEVISKLRTLQSQFEEARKNPPRDDGNNRDDDES